MREVIHIFVLWNYLRSGASAMADHCANPDPTPACLIMVHNSANTNDDHRAWLSGSPHFPKLPPGSTRCCTEYRTQ
ncbi:hypothetical protein EDD17DRAFT_1634723 [Pisolithus thermaeus]|nr:hypothetical protein EDD17DRAFT_1634723 [Pisolithus thermaeus]